MLKLPFLLCLEKSLIKNGSSSVQSNKSSSSSAFAGKINDNRKFKGRNQNLVCKNYGIKGHTIEKCNKLIGYPKDFKYKYDFNKVSSSGTAFPC